LSGVNRARLRSIALGAGVVLVAINLRPAAAAIGPLLDRIQNDTGLSSGWAGALTTLPVLCFGLLAPLAPLLARRLGLRTSLAGAMVVLLAGMLLRLVPGVGLLFIGTAVAGAAIAIGNVLVPVLVRRDFAHRTGTAMSLYTMSLIGFAALSAGVTVPLADALGGGWRPGLAVWAIPAAVAALAWAPALVHRDAPPSEGRPVGVGQVRALLRQPLAWAVTLFFAVQSGGFYATLAWLPSIFRSHGASESHAGLLLSLTMVVGLITALVVPGLAGRSRDQRLLVLASCVLTAVGLLGILLAPMSAPYVWAVVLGLGQNAAFPLALMLIVMRGGTVANTEALSTMAQSVGYILSSLAPLAVGALHGITHSWSPPLILLLALVAPEVLFGLAAGRDRRLPGPAPPAPEPGAPQVAYVSDHSRQSR
jgi:CP family cyanate transporter-like MFS transporter